MKTHLIGCALCLMTFSLGMTLTNIAFQKQPINLPEPPVTLIAYSIGEGPEIKEAFDTVDRYGWYSFDEFKGMSEAYLIAVNGDEEDPGGGVFTTFENYGDQGFFDSTSAKINVNHVIFQTERLHGISYKFEGTFLSDNWSASDAPKPLYGTLKKFVKGKLVAEHTGNMEYHEPHCWH